MDKEIIDKFPFASISSMRIINTCAACNPNDVDVNMFPYPGVYSLKYSSGTETYLVFFDGVDYSIAFVSGETAKFLGI